MEDGYVKYSGFKPGPRYELIYLEGDEFFHSI